VSKIVLNNPDNFPIKILNRFKDIAVFVVGSFLLYSSSRLTSETAGAGCIQPYLLTCLLTCMKVDDGGVVGERKERPRTEYAAKCTTTEVNPITGIEEPYFPQQQRTHRLVSGYAVIILMVKPSKCTSFMCAKIIETHRNDACHCHLSLCLN